MRSLKWPSMQRWQCLIYNVTLKTFICRLCWRLWNRPFLSRKVNISVRFPISPLINDKCAHVNFAEKPQIKIKSLKKAKVLLPNSYLIRQSFEGYKIVNRALVPLHGGSLEFTLTVPFSWPIKLWKGKTIFQQYFDIFHVVFCK